MKVSATCAWFIGAALLVNGVEGQRRRTFVTGQTVLPLPTEAQTASPTTSSTSGTTGITVTSDVFIFNETSVEGNFMPEGTFMPTETDTRPPADGTPVPLETISPSDTLVLGTPSPSAFGSMEDTMIMDETEDLNVTSTEANETDVTSSLLNQTSNVSDIIIEPEDDEEEVTIAPSEEMIEVEPTTESPTQSPTEQATVNPAPTEQVAASSTSDAPKHDFYSSPLLSVALVFVSTFMLVTI